MSKRCFCSPKCKCKANPGGKKNALVNSCIICGKPFMTRACFVNNGVAKTCSIKCKNVYAGKRFHEIHPTRHGSNHSMKKEAYSQYRSALKSGILVKQPCERCGSVNHVHGHHEDYLLPLSVKWLCSKHHIEIHSQMVA